MKMKILAMACLMLQFNAYADATYADAKGDADRAAADREEALSDAETIKNNNRNLANACTDNSPRCEQLRRSANDAETQYTALVKAEKRRVINEAEKKRGLANDCTLLANQAKAKLKQNSNNENLDGDTGTKVMKRCVDLTNGNMRYLYGKNRSAVSWNDIINGTDECIAASDKCTAQLTDPNEIQKKKDACNKVTAELARCDAAAFIISGFDRNWENPEHVKTIDVKGGNPPITCQGKGVATVDYDSCVKFVQNGDIMDVAQGAIQKGQELYYADKTMTAQADAAKSDNSATAALQALKSSVNSQKEIMEQRAAIDSGKLAVLANYYMDMPTNDDVKAKCAKYTLPDELNKNNSVAKTLCEQVANENSFGFLMNPMAKEKMKAKLVKVGIDVGSDAVMAGLMAKRAGDINNAIANVESFKPIDPIAPQANNLQTTFCQQNPGDPKCLTGGLDRTFDAMNDNVVTFGDGGTGTSYANTNPFTGDGTTTTNAVSPTDRKSVTGVGSTIAAAQQGSGLANPIAAGAITKGSGPTGGGGGGGSAGGGGGGGGGGLPSSQGQGGVSSAIAGRAPAYNGGSGFSILNGGGGLRGGGKAKDKEENPFGKLFNKNGNANGAVNFREIASKVGGKSDNIFDMISNRYSKVSTEKRLLEYEIAK